MDKAGTEVVEAEAVGHKEHQSDRLTEPWCPSVRPVQTGDRSGIIELVGLAKRKNNSCCVPEPLEHPNSWEIGRSVCGTERGVSHCAHT